MPALALFLAFASVGAVAAQSGSTKQANRLAVNGTSLTYGSQRVFLAGANQPWRNYGADWGDNHPTAEDWCVLKDALVNVSRAGGNSIRFWVFTEGAHIPRWAPDGLSVLAGDTANTLAESMRRYTRLAASHNILVIWCLWNGASSDRAMDARTRAMIEDPSGAALTSFIDNALVPLVKSLAGEPGLGAWEIMNEPEGSVSLTKDILSAEPCFNPKLTSSLNGWSGNNISMRNLQRFVALQTVAIHQADPTVLVTIGSASELNIISTDGSFNYWSDHCLQQALGNSTQRNVPAMDHGAARFLDFYQAHIWPLGPEHNGTWQPTAPFFGGGRPKSSYQLDKPLVLGEFPAGHTVAHGTETATQLFEYTMAGGYDGGWGWCLCVPPACTGNAGNLGIQTIGPALAAIKAMRDINITVGGPAPEPDSCPTLPPAEPWLPQPPMPCTDTPPAWLRNITCAEESQRGGCKKDAMRGYCCRSCTACVGILQCGGLSDAAEVALHV